MKVLIATDGSEIGNKVADYGVRFAVKLGAAVHGVFVINPKTVELRAMEHKDNSPGHATEVDRERKYGEETLARLSSRCASAGLKASTDVLIGNPAEEIVKIAAQKRRT